MTKDLLLQWVTPSVPADAPQQDPAELTTLIAGLLSHYWQADEPEAVYRVKMMLWRDALTDIPQMAVERAILHWNRHMTGRPEPAQIREIARRHITPTTRPALRLVEDKPPAPHMTAAEARRAFAEAGGDRNGNSFMDRIGREFIEGLEAMERGEATIVHGPIARIIGAVAAASGVPENELLSGRRSARTCRARFAVMHIARTSTTKTFTEIGRAIGGRDHTTIIAGCARAREMIETDLDFAALVADVERRLSE